MIGFENHRLKKMNNIQQKICMGLLLMAMISTVAFIAAPQAVHAHEYGGITYHDTDYDKLVAFLELPNGTEKNGNKISATYNPNDPATWSGVTWNSDASKRITGIDWSGKNLVGSLDVSGLTSLQTLRCDFNQLTSLDVSGLTSLKDLQCFSNDLTSLNVSGCTSLQTLYCNGNQLTGSLDVSGLIALQDLQCHSNQLTSLNVSGLTSLQYLYCGSNQLTSLNVSGLTSLQTLSCYTNQLTSLDVSGCTSLRYLDCHSNQLTFSDLPISLPVGGGTYEFSPQAVVPIGVGEIPAMVELDLSAEANISGIPTVFTWYQAGGEVIDRAKYVENNGRFIFDESLVGKTIYCAMTNTRFDGLTLTTSQVQVIPSSHSITFIKPTTANDATNPVNINSGSLVIARINGDLNEVTSVTVNVDDGTGQSLTPSNTIYYLLPTNLTTGEHIITIKLTTKDGQLIEYAVKFYWQNYRRGFGFGRFDFGEADEH